MTPHPRAAAMIIPLAIRRSVSWLIAGFTCGVAATAAPLEVARIERTTPVLFEPDVLPVLQRNCLACHSASERQGDLVLESVAAMLTGGDSGPAIVPGSAEKSLLVSLAAHRADPVMPPADNDVNASDLGPEELGLLTLWIDQGAKSAGTGGIASPRDWRPIATQFAPASAVAVTPDAQYVTLARGNRLLLHHVPSGRLVTELVDPALGVSGGGHRDLVESLAFNREGDMLASGGFREAKIWRRPRDVRAFEVAAGPATAVAASPDGRLFATASAGAIRIWRAADGSAGPVIEGSAAGTTALVFADAGDTLVAGGADGTIRRWRTSDGGPLGGIDLPQPVRALAVVATGGQLPGAADVDAALVVSGTDAGLRTLRLPDRTATKPVPDAAVRRRIAVSHDRTMIAVAREAAVRILSLDDEAGATTRAEWPLDRGPATSLCILESPSGTRALATGATDGSISLWSLPEGRLLRRFAAAAAPVTAVAASGDGATLGSADDKGGVAMWRGLDDEPERTPVAAGTLEAVTATAFHAGRRLLATAGSTGGAAVVVVHALDGTAAPIVLRGHTGVVRGLAFSADGSRLVSGGDDRSIRIWDCGRPEGTQLAVVPDAAAVVTRVAASGDLTQVLAAGADHVLRVFTVADGMLARDYRGHAAAVLAVGFTPAGQPWSAAADATVRFWNPADGQQAAAWNLAPPPVAVAASADGQLLLAAGTDGVVRSHQLAGGQLVKAFTGPAGVATSLALAADASRAVSLEMAADKTTIRSWDVVAGRLLEARESAPVAAAIPESPAAIVVVTPQAAVERLRTVLQRPIDGLTQPIVGLAMSGTTSLLVAAADGGVRGFQLATGQPTISVAAGGPALAIAATPDGGLFAVGCKGGVAKLWKADGSPVGPGIGGLAGDVAALALSADGRRLVVGLSAAPQGAAALSVHDPLTGAMLERFSGHAAGIADVAVSADGRSVVSSGDDAIARWPLEVLGLLPGQGGPATALAAIPTAPLELLVGGGDGLVKRVRLSDGQVAGQFQHGGAVHAVAVRPDGSRFASVGETGSLRLWRADGQPVAEVRGDLRRIAAVARLTRQQAAAAERVVVAKKRAEDAEKDVPAKTELATKAKATLDAAEADVKAKQDAFATADAARIAAEKNSLAASADARTAVVAKQRADRQVQDVQLELQTAQQKSTLLAAAAAAMPGDAGRKQVAEAAVQAVAAAQQRLQQMQSAAQAAATAATTAATAANGMTQKVTDTQKPAADAAAVLRTAQTARRLALQQHEIAARELAASTAALPVARETLARTEAVVAETKQTLEKATADAAAAVAPIRHVAFSADGSTVATAGAFPAAHLWDAETGSAVAAFVGHATPLAGVAYLADGRLVTAAADATAIAWELNPAWKLERTIGAADRPDLIADRVLALDWSGDSAAVLVGGGVPSRSGELGVFQVADGTRVLHLPDAHDDAVLAARFSPDGKRIASAGADKYLRTFDAVTGERIRRFEGHTNYVLALGWKADGQTLASAGADNTVKLWDAETGDQRTTVATFKRHVTSLRFVGDGDTFVTGCGDRVPRLHNGNGGVIRAFPEMTGWIHSVDVTPGGEVLVAGAADGSVKAWNATTGQPLPDLDSTSP